jgi:hypothetical protein
MRLVVTVEIPRVLILVGPAEAVLAGRYGLWQLGLRVQVVSAPGSGAQMALVQA